MKEITTEAEALKTIKDDIDDFAFGCGDDILNRIPEELKTSEFYLKAIRDIRSGWLVFVYVPDELKTLEMCLEAIKQDYYSLQNVPANLKTLEICLAAATGAAKEEDDGVLEYVPEKFQEQVKQVKANVPARKRNITKASKSLSDIPYELRTTKDCLEAVRRYGGALEYVPDKLKTPEMCHRAVSEWGENIDFVPDELRTLEIYLFSINCDALRLKNVPENLKTIGLCFEAVRQNGMALEFVPESLKSFDLCLDAVGDKSKAIKFVPKKFQKQVKAELEKTVK